MGEPETAHVAVWDDSALLSSWNEAFDEFKKYHSIAARGETVQVTAKVVDADPEATQNAEDDIQDVVDAKPASTAPAASASNKVHGNTNGDVPAIPPATTSTSSSAITPANIEGTLAVPQALMASVQDDELKNLMISWYYSGYYTGLYEGKQQGYALAKEQMSRG